MGYLPTKINTSQRVMNLISIFGAGLLVGAALIVIVPEGMIVLVDSMASPHEHGAEESKPEGGHSHGKNEMIARYIGASLIIGFTVMLMID